MSKLNAAVVGTGFIGPVHVEALQRAGVTVTGILGSRPEKSTAAQQTLGLEKAYGSLDELLSDDSVDVVHVTSPNQHHFAQVTAAIESGKHVLCEKPLAMTPDESAKLVELADAKGIAAGVNYNIRYYPLCIEAARRVASGKSGRVFHVTGSYVQDWLFHPSDFNWRVLKEEGGALRAVADIGTHWLDLIQHVVGQKVVSVCADLGTVFAERTRPLGGVETFSGKVNADQATETVAVDTEDFGSAMLEFADGCRGTLFVSQVTAGRKNCLRFEIAAGNESLAWNSETPNEIWLGQRDTPNQVLLKDPALVDSTAASAMSYPGGHNEGFPDTFKQLFVDFYRAIETGSYKDSPTFPTFADGHHEILVCDAILKSHQQRKWVSVDV